MAQFCDPPALTTFSVSAEGAEILRHTSLAPHLQWRTMPVINAVSIYDAPDLQCCLWNRLLRKSGAGCTVLS